MHHALCAWPQRSSADSRPAQRLRAGTRCERQICCCAWLLGERHSGLKACTSLPCSPLDSCSVTLLDSFTIPMALVLSAALLGASYRRGHYAGAAVCVAGLLLLVATDRSSSGSSGDGDSGSGTSNPLLGDGLVVLGATLYALCNVLQEWLLGE